MPNLKGRSWSSLVDQSIACAHCGEAASKKCGKCKNARYCSEECQTADWGMHKSLCASWDSFKDRPSSNLRRVILLKATASVPQFAWMPTKLVSRADDEEDLSDAKGGKENENGNGIREGQSGSMQQGDEYYDEELGDEDDFVPDLGVPFTDPQGDPSFFPELHCHLGGGLVQPIQVVVGKMGSGELLDHCIFAAVRETFCYDGSLPNDCIRAASNGAVTMWRGPIMIYGTPKAESSPSCLDLDTNDLTLAINGLVEYQKKTRDPMGYWMRSKLPKKVTGVKIVKDNGSGHDGVTLWKYEEVQVPVDHPVFLSDSKMHSQAPGGFPFKVHLSGKPTTNEVFKPKHIGDFNRAVSIQLLSLISSRVIPNNWETDRGALIVARNRKPLDKLMVQNLCRLAIEKLKPLFLKAMESSKADASTSEAFDEETEGLGGKFEDLKMGVRSGSGDGKDKTKPL